MPQHVLRFWETKFEQVQPLKRNGRRRYYRPEDKELLQGVRDLLYGEGYTIRGVQKLLSEGVRSPADLAGRNTEDTRSNLTSKGFLPEWVPLPEPPSRATKNEAARFRIKIARKRLADLTAALGKTDAKT